MARQDIKKTGWPEGLLQDDDARLSRWFASRPDARYILKRNLEIDMDKPTYFTDNHAVSMTLRDYFAAKAMQALIQTSYFDTTARMSYDMADAMMKARGE